MSSIRRLGVATLATALLLGLAACGSDDDVPSAGHPKTDIDLTQADPSGASVPSNVPEAGAKADGSVDWCVGQDPFTGPAADQFGADNVMTAYCEMVEFTMTNAWVPTLMREDDPQAVEFSFMNDYMTANMQDSWAAVVQKALAGDDTADQQVQGLTVYGLVGEGVSFPEDDSLVRNQAAGSAALTLDKEGPNGDYRLGMTFTASADFRILKNGEPMLVPFTKDITYYLVPNGDATRPWLIDGSQAVYRVGEMRADDTPQ